jgi:MFS transporter, UMF1 family
MAVSPTSTRRPSKSAFEKASNDDDEESPSAPVIAPATSSTCDPQSPPCDATLRRLLRVPLLFRFDDKPPEATALALDIFARATILMSSIFLGPALLELASQQVQDTCQTADDPQACVQDGRVYGFRPSSVLSNIAVVSGVCVSLTMPLIGALVDHSPHRWNAGALSAAGLVTVKAVETTVSSQTWFIVAFLQVASAMLYQIHITTTLSYTSELSTDANEQTQYNTYFVVVLYAASLMFLAFVTAMSFLFSQNDIGTARISQVTTSTVSAIVFYSAWAYFFRHRQARNVVPQGQTLMSVGFRKVGTTFAMIVRELPALKWLIFAIMFGEAATSTLITVATSYMKVFLHMDANEIGLTFLAVLVMGGPGSKLGGWIALRTSPVISATICHGVFILVTTVACLAIDGPQHKRFMPIPGAVWGLCLGWLLPMHSTAYISNIPRGQEAELMGLYVMAGQSLSWLPPIVFTSLNEIGVDMAMALASLNIFFVCAATCLVMVVYTGRSALSSIDVQDYSFCGSDCGKPSPEPGCVVELDDMALQGVHRNASALPAID